MTILGPSLFGIAVGAAAFPDDFVSEIIFAKNLIEHDFDVMTGVPVAVIIKTAGLFEDAGKLHAARPHVFNVSLGGFVAVFKRAFLFGLAPKDFVIAVGLKGLFYVNQVGGGARQFGKLFEIVAAINNARVEKRGRFQPRRSNGSFRSGFLCHAASVRRKFVSVNSAFTCLASFAVKTFLCLIRVQSVAD